MPETLVYRRDNVAHHIDEASKEFIQGLPAAALRSLADARDSLNVAIAETISAAIDPEETAEPLTWDVVAHALHLSADDARERYESYCRRRAYEAPESRDIGIGVPVPVDIIPAIWDDREPTS